jgi:hypothetical protein
MLLQLYSGYKAYGGSKVAARVEGVNMGLAKPPRRIN